MKVKRNLAPYLKGIMGHWLIAQCDTYSPAASAAIAAFQAAFPLNKQPEALSFCKDDVLSVSLNNMTHEYMCVIKLRNNSLYVGMASS